jgi:hypothetical protein
VGDQLESLGFPARKLTEGLPAPEVAEPNFDEEREGLADL